MADLIPSHRQDVARAFQSLQSEPPELKTPEDFVAYARRLMTGYGAVGADHDLQGVVVRPVDAGGVKADYLLPADAKSGERIVYIHGGGWIAGTAQSYRPLGALLARASGLPVLMVDYGLAPENPFPGPIEECRRVLAWAAANGPDGAGAAPVFLAGDSAGANLAAATCLRQIETGGVLPVAVALLCGVLDLADRGHVARHDPIGGLESLTGTFGLYGQGKVAADDPLISPVNAADDVLAKFPPTLLQASADEYLMPGSQAFAARLAAVGGRSVMSTWPLVPHSWHTFVEMLPESPQAIAEVAAFFAAYAKG